MRNWQKILEFFDNKIMNVVESFIDTDLQNRSNFLEV